jgi:hypothetical protein
MTRRKGGPDAAYERDPESYNAPVTRRNEWLEAHPGAVIGYPQKDRPLLAAVIADTVLAISGGDVGELMDQVDAAENAGNCPLHRGGQS